MRNRTLARRLAMLALAGVLAAGPAVPAMTGLSAGYITGSDNNVRQVLSSVSFPVPGIWHIKHGPITHKE